MSWHQTLLGLNQAQPCDTDLPKLLASLVQSGRQGRFSQLLKVNLVLRTPALGLGALPLLLIPPVSLVLSLPSS